MIKPMLVWCRRCAKAVFIMGPDGACRGCGRRVLPADPEAIQ